MEVILEIRKIRSQFIPLASNTDLFGHRFVTMAEALHFPFYGVQFHPEKVVYDWSDDLAIQRGQHQIQAQYFFMNFFVNQIKKRGLLRKTDLLCSRLLRQADVKYFGMDVYFFSRRRHYDTTLLRGDDCLSCPVAGYLETYKVYMLLSANLAILCYAFLVQHRQLVCLKNKEKDS